MLFPDKIGDIPTNFKRISPTARVFGKVYREKHRISDPDYADGSDTGVELIKPAMEGTSLRGKTVTVAMNNKDCKAHKQDEMLMGENTDGFVQGISFHVGVS